MGLDMLESQPSIQEGADIELQFVHFSGEGIARGPTPISTPTCRLTVKMHDSRSKWHEVQGLSKPQ